MKEGFATTSRQILADRVHMGSAQIVISTSGFAHLQNQVGGTLWPGNMEEIQVCLIEILKQDVCQPHTPVCSYWGRILSHSPTHWGRVPSAPSDKKSRDNSWKLCGPVALELREEQTEPIVCRAIGLIWPRNISLGLLELRQQRPLLVLQLLLQLHTGRESNAWPCSWLNVAFSYLTRKPNQSTQETT